MKHIKMGVTSNDLLTFFRVQFVFLLQSFADDFFLSKLTHVVPYLMSDFMYEHRIREVVIFNTICCKKIHSSRQIIIFDSFYFKHGGEN